MDAIKLRLRDLRRPEQAPGLYDLVRSPVRVGRGPRCEIRLHTDEIADVQVIIRRETDHWRLHPVGPATGCRTPSGWLHESIALASGFKFEIGQVEFEFDPLPEFQKEFSSPAETDLHLEEAPQLIESTLVSSLPEDPVSPASIVPQAKISVENKRVAFKSLSTQIAPIDLETNALKPGQYSSISKVGAKGAATFAAFDSTTLSDSRSGQKLKELKSAGASLVENDLESPSIRKLNLLKSSSAGHVIPDSFVDATKPETQPSLPRRVARHEINETTSLQQTLSQWAADYSRKTKFKVDQSTKKAVQDCSFPENEISSPKSSIFSKAHFKTDAIAPLLAFDEVIEPQAEPVEVSTQKTEPLFSIIESANTAEILLEECNSGIVAQASTANIGIEESDLYQPEFESDDYFFQPDPLLLSNIHSEEEIIENNSNESRQDFIDTEDDTFEAIVDLNSLGMAEFNPVTDSENERNSHLIAEFEEWLGNVGPILDSIPHVSTSESSPPMAEQGSHDLISVAGIEVEMESASVEMLIHQPVELLGDSELSPEDSSFTEFESEPSQSSENHEHADTIDSHFIESISNEMQPEENDSEVQSRPDDAEINGWPSVGDIMRWSATRDGSLIDRASSFSATRTDQPSESLEPSAFLKMNLPLALFLSAGIGAATFAAGYLSYRMGVQDELTQKAVSAVITAARTDQPPRLASPTLKKLAENRSWWELPAEQIWWRASLMKQREEGGLDVPQSSEVMAQQAVQASPVLSTARLWKLTRYPELTKSADWNNLSRDVLTLVTTADHFRRIGEHERAKSADRMALEMVTRSDMIFDSGRIHFDSELGTNRFLLPGQYESLVILRRLLKEPDAGNLIMSVMPEHRPEIWLTAAELIERNGLGDPSPLYARILELEKITTPGTSQRQRLHQSVLAEAQAQTARISQSIETYQAIVAQMPENDLKRSWYYNLGELSQRQQDRSAAAAYWRKARSLNPNHEVDRHAIAATRSLQTGTAAPEMTSTILRTN